MVSARVYEILVYLAEVAVGEELPSSDTFLFFLQLYHKEICSGAELYGLVWPVARLFILHDRPCVAEDEAKTASDTYRVTSTSPTTTVCDSSSSNSSIVTSSAVHANAAHCPTDDQTGIPDAFRFSHPASDTRPSAIAPRGLSWLLRLCHEQLHLALRNGSAGGTGLAALLHVTELIVRHYIGDTIHSEQTSLHRQQHNVCSKGVCSYDDSSSNTRRSEEDDVRGTHRHADYDGGHELPKQHNPSEQKSHVTRTQQRTCTRYCGSVVITKLQHVLLSYAAMVPLNRDTLVTHTEAARLILTLSSSRLYGHTYNHIIVNHSSQATLQGGSSNYSGTATLEPETDDMLSVQSFPLVQKLVFTLMHRLSLWGSHTDTLLSSTMLYAQDCQPSLWNLYHLFGTSKRVHHDDYSGVVSSSGSPGDAAATAVGSGDAVVSTAAAAGDLPALNSSTLAMDDVTVHAFDQLVVINNTAAADGGNDFVKPRWDLDSPMYGPSLISVLTRCTCAERLHRSSAQLLVLLLTQPFFDTTFAQDDEPTSKSFGHDVGQNESGDDDSIGKNSKINNDHDDNNKLDACNTHHAVRLLALSMLRTAPSSSSFLRSLVQVIAQKLSLDCPALAMLLYLVLREDAERFICQLEHSSSSSPITMPTSSTSTWLRVPAAQNSPSSSLLLELFMAVVQLLIHANAMCDDCHMDETIFMKELYARRSSDNGHHHNLDHDSNTSKVKHDCNSNEVNSDHWDAARSSNLETVNDHDDHGQKHSTSPAPIESNLPSWEALGSVDTLLSIHRATAPLRASYARLMAATLLLMFSQHEAVNTALCRGSCVPHARFMPHHFRTAKVPALALSVAVLCSTIVQALNARHVALADLCVPCLINMAPHVHNVDLVTAECLVALVVQLIQRLARLERAWLWKKELSRVRHRRRQAEHARPAGNLCELSDKSNATINNAIDNMDSTTAHCKRRTRCGDCFDNDTADLDNNSSSAVPLPTSFVTVQLGGDELNKQQVTYVDDYGVQTRHALCEMTLRQLAGVVEAVETMLCDSTYNNDALILMLLYAQEFMMLRRDEAEANDTSAVQQHEQRPPPPPPQEEGGVSAQSNVQANTSDGMSGPALDLIMSKEAGDRKSDLAGDAQEKDEGYAQAVQNSSSSSSNDSPHHTQNAVRGLFTAQAEYITRNLIELIANYQNAVASAVDEVHTVEDVLQIIREKSHRHEQALPHALSHAPQDLLIHASAHETEKNGTKLRHHHALQSDGTRATFVYKEMVQSDEFFSRFVWSSMLSDAACPGGILWSRSVSELALFTTPTT